MKPTDKKLRQIALPPHSFELSRAGMSESFDMPGATCVQNTADILQSHENLRGDKCGIAQTD